MNSKTKKSYSKKKSRLINSTSIKKSKTRKALGVSTYSHKLNQMERLKEMRELRINAYLNYTRNAKYLLMVGSITHRRIYSSLKREDETYRDFCRQNPSLDLLYHLFIRQNKITLSILKENERKLKEETEKIRQKAEKDLQFFYEYEKQKETKQLQETSEKINKLHVKYENELYVKEEQLRKYSNVVDTVREERDRFIQMYEILLHKQHVSQQEQKKMTEQIHHLQFNVNLQEQIAQDFERQNRMMHQELEWSARIIENLSKKVEDLQLEIDSMYYNDLFTRGMNFASSVLSDTMTYLEKIGAETNATIMNEKREKKKRMEEKRRLEKIWKEAEELRNKMEQEQMEKEEQMERERQERERQEEERRRQEEEERKRQEEEERKRQEEEERRRQRDNRKRQREHSQQNTGRTSNDDGCVSRGKVPKIANTKSEYRKLLLLFHPDKNLGCTSEANKKFRLLRELNRSNPVLETSK
jgi:hypothetical protein